MKKTTLLLSAITLATGLLSTQAQAVEGLTANAAIGSNYIFRGVSQTDDSAAISGGIDYVNGGFYTGAWLSNVELVESESTTELDLYVGYKFNYDAFNFDLGLINYSYADSEGVYKNLENSEIYASVNWEWLTVGFNTLADSDTRGVDFGDAVYLYTDAVFEISEGLELGLHVGNQDFDGNGYDYNDWGISLSKKGFTLAITDTDNNNDDMNFTISYSMDFDL